MQTIKDLNLNFNTLENSIKTIIVLTIVIVGIAATCKEIFFN